MVAATAATTVAAGSRKSPNPHKNASAPPHSDGLRNPHPRMLIPSEKDNAATGAGRARTKKVNSRFLPSYSCPSSSTATSCSTATTFSSSSSQRFPSPFVTPRPSTPPALPQCAAQKRSHSVGRVRPSTTVARPCPTPAEPSAATRAFCMTRSLSVSFQGESFFYRISRPKPASPTSERRRHGATCAPLAKAGDHLENSRPSDSHHLWPASRAPPSNPLTRSLNCSSEKKEPILATVRLLEQSMMFDDTTRRASFDQGDLSASSDTDSVSSGSNSGTPEFSVLPRAKVTPRGISVPARFWEETNNRLYRHPEPCSPSSSPDARPVVQPKLGTVKKLSVDNPLSCSRPASLHHGTMAPSSLSKPITSPSRGMASPLRTRSNALLNSSPFGQPGNAPSIISFSTEVRRAKKGENRIEEAHLLRLLDNRHLQWRCVNARAYSALLMQKLAVEKKLYDAWITTSKLRESITIKRIKLQLLTQNLKLTSILKGQMASLDEWSVMEKDHSSSLCGSIEALNASTLRLPVVSGAKADILEVKDAVGSTVDMMQAMGSSIFSLLSKVEGMSTLVSNITKVVAQERALLERSRDLLSTVAAMDVKQCSLQGHLIQLKRGAHLI
ncbi:QWRF motif-containing protein 2-like isoform X1 [Musa acuminata AAA Group]|uniref:QWRF motif-containing protein 2-like isoform X1 n=1 Tax=Musa acuminata AAA Group TaxID=214697 RepID=UPI0031D8AB2F